MFCRYCGQELPDDSVFCSKCGKKVQHEGAEAPAEVKAEPAKPATPPEPKVEHCRLELVEASGVWLRWGLAAVSAGLAAAWCVYWIRGRRQGS